MIYIRIEIELIENLNVDYTN